MANESPSVESKAGKASGGLLHIALVAVLVITSFWLLIVGRKFLIPIVLAVFVWYLIEAMLGFWKRFRIAGRPIPRLAPAILSALVIFGFCFGFLSMVASNVSKMTELAPGYQENLMTMYSNVVEKLGIDEHGLSDRLMEKLDLGSMAASTGAMFGGLLGTGALIAMYVAFLLLERSFFTPKLEALVSTPSRREGIRSAIGRVDREVRIYLSMKISVSLLTAVLSYVIMRLIGVNFPEFWAALIFIFNFIPYIGSTVATLLPTLLALVQFDTLRPAVLVFVGIQCVQIGVGSLIEPALMGKSLNMSPMVVMLALTFWGMIWGVAGMFLAVPLTVVIMIVCANFEGSRWVAVVLSKDGVIKGA
jgi:AI-2 transport protein TqsA